MAVFSVLFLDALGDKRDKRAQGGHMLNMGVPSFAGMVSISQHNGYRSYCSLTRLQGASYCAVQK